MDESPDPVGSREAVTETWRAQSLNTVVWISLVAAFPALLMVAWGWPDPLSPTVRCLAVLLYAGLAVIAVCRRGGTTWRTWAFFLLAYVLVGLQLYRAGLAGSGRIGIVIIPLYVLLLTGVRSGWVALGLGVGLYSAFVGLLAWGLLGEWLEVRENSTEPADWVLQGVMLLTGVVPLFLLVSRFRTLHVQAVEAECRASARVRDEIGMRIAAYEALERADRERRRLEEEITRASEAERRRLGAELHDGLCQQLTAALLQCVALENQSVAEPRSAATAVRTLRHLLEDSIGAAYEVARGLCPLDIGADSLDSALERLAKQTRAATGVKCDFQGDGDATIGDEQAAIRLYRIAQEAVANATKHARPRRIGITLRGAPDGLVLQIEDDGCGMPAAPAEAGRMGMKLMAYRANLLGGTLAVEPVPGGGTRIVCRVPRENPGAMGVGGPATFPVAFSAAQEGNSQ